MKIYLSNWIFVIYNENTSIILFCLLKSYLISQPDFNPWDENPTLKIVVWICIDPTSVGVAGFVIADTSYGSPKRREKPG